MQQETKSFSCTMMMRDDDDGDQEVIMDIRFWGSG
jgi:hypothetical protein